MFCENCGHQVNAGEKFCQNCGSPINAQPVQPEPVQQPAQPEYTAPVQPEATQPVQPEYTAPVQPEYPQAAPVEPIADGYTQQPAQYSEPAPKKPMSKGLKMGIIFGSAGLAVIIAALVIIFAVVVPNVSKVDVQKYFSVDIRGLEDTVYEQEVYGKEENLSVADGAINGYFEFDYGQFAIDKGLKVADAESSSQNALYAISSYIDVDVELKSGTGEADYYSFDNASKDNVYTVTLKWPEKDSLYAIALNQQEKESGVSFKHDNVTFEFKLADYLSKRGIEVKEAVEADVLSYIKDNNLIYSTGESGNATVGVKAFETVINGYIFKNNSDYSTSIDIFDESTDEYLSYFYVEFSNDYGLYDGDTVTLDYDSYYVSKAAEAGIKLTGSPVSYKVKAEKSATPATEPQTTVPAKEEGMSVEEALTAKDALKALFTARLEKVIEEDSDAKKGDKLELQTMYYSHDLDSDFRRFMFIYKNTTSNYFKAIETDPEDIYVKDGKLVNEDGEAFSDTDYLYLSESEKGKTLEEAIENCWYLSSTYSEYYKNTEIK